MDNAQINADRLRWRELRFAQRADREEIAEMMTRHAAAIGEHLREHEAAAGDQCNAAPLCLGYAGWDLLDGFAGRLGEYGRLLNGHLIIQLTRAQDEIAALGVTVLDQRNRLHEADALVAQCSAELAKLNARLAASEAVIADMRIPYVTGEES